MDTKGIASYSQIENAQDNDSNSAAESEIEDGYYTTLGPSSANISVLLYMPNHIYFYFFINILCWKQLWEVSSFTFKYKINIAVKFFTVKTKKTKWIESWKGIRYPEIQIKEANEGNLPFFMHISGYVGKSGVAGFDVIVRDYTGIPILAYSSASDDDNISASSLEIDGVFKGLEITQKF
ncbi:hypothetical protein MKX01_030410 [Papaver californicum]|nr:hypothetical protein MKX01_030410 [Papaver californicum]